MRTIKKSTQLALADAIRAKSGSTKTMTTEDMVTAIEGLNVTNVSYPLADVPTTMGQRAALARAAQMRDIQYTTVAAMPNYYPTDKYYPANRTLTGLLYSSVRASDNFIGHDISLHTFMTALRNPNSVLYTKDYNSVYRPEGIANGVEGTWYGTNCSSFVAYALGMPYHPATSELPLYHATEIEGIDNIQLCDYLNSNKRYSDGTTAGHTVLITGIWRDKDGAIQQLEITDHGMHSTPMGVITKTIETRESFVEKYITTYNYRIYRYDRLYDCAYKPSPYIPLFDEPADAVVYSDLCTDLGDKVVLTTEECITVQPLVTDGYASIIVYKDGAAVRTIDLAAWDGSAWTANEGVFDAPEAGRYVAVLVGEDGDATPLATNSTSWIVCAVDGYREGDTFYFPHDTNCRPLAVVLKDGSGLIGADGGKGMTLGYFEPTDEDIARGYMTIDIAAHLAQFGDTESSVKWVAMSFANEYGCCHKGYAYTAAGTGGDSGDSGTVPAAYQIVDKITTDGASHIDTGVSAADYPEGIKYTLEGKITGSSGAGSTGNNYLFGALAVPSGSSTKVRTGNAVYNSTSNNIGVICGTGTGILCQMDSGQVDLTAEFTMVVSASAKTGTLALTYNGRESTSAAVVTTDVLPTATIYLFAVNGASGCYEGECRGFQMISLADGTPIRKFVPCYRVADGVIGLYDTVEGKFYTNAGTGTFTKGADV